MMKVVYAAPLYFFNTCLQRSPELNRYFRSRTSHHSRLHFKATMAANDRDKDIESGISRHSFADHASVHRRDSPDENQLTKSVSMDADLFERLYLSPKGQTTGDLRKRFANPTPVALLGFSVGLLPLAVDYMGWRGAGGPSTSTVLGSVVDNANRT